MSMLTMLQLAARALKNHNSPDSSLSDYMRSRAPVTTMCS
jgi:hypothetical protein